MGVKERPILFSGPMVRAILGGRKTQTRRVVKPQPPKEFLTGDVAAITNGERWSLSKMPGRKAWHPDPHPGILCPYGQPGDRLWARETWGAHFMWNGVPPAQIPNDGRTCLFYKADGAIVRGCESSQVTKWRPSINMPRWASRITLEITGVRVERLNKISETDAAAEGIAIRRSAYGIYECKLPDGKTHFDDSAVDLFRKLWESINGPGSFDSRWVWVLEFRRIDA